ncbi:mucin-5B-like [Spea bombifrons]|uniref:mucin-5B-like n=1 Tax=Spea bombifrons TaxID=233779 RepID=UPI00234B8A3D|nr:mucin-5B-like [Spea bombifrons]
MGELQAQIQELVFASEEEYVFDQMRGVIPFTSNNSLPGSHPIKTIGINHNKVCSYWNNFHYMTFDGNIFYFPGTCNYVFSSHCKSNYEDFLIQIRHSVVNNVLSHCRITMKIDVTLVEMIDHDVMVNGILVDLPYSEPALVIQKIGVYTKTIAKIGLVFLKKEDGSFQLQLAEKYANQTCGLCGDFNGSPLSNEFILNGIQISDTEFGDLQKLEGPNEQCEATEPPDWNDCADKDNICENILKGPSFASCNAVLDAKPYIDACIKDLCRCKKENHNSCHCSTITEYSRQCIYHGGKPENWRTKDLCPKMCSSNMEYKECGSPCSDSCSDPERVLTCDEYCMAGCFCPEGLILDDISNYECIPIEKCSCTYNGNIYSPGASYSTSCSTCVCFNGKWDCKNIPCSATCAIEGGSHITTFDEMRYDVHGDCIYVISKLCTASNFTVLGELRPCGRRETESCLRGVTIILNTGQSTLPVWATNYSSRLHLHMVDLNSQILIAKDSSLKLQMFLSFKMTALAVPILALTSTSVSPDAAALTIEIKSLGDVYLNFMYTELPVTTATFILFKPSPFYIIFNANFGLQVVIQIQPFLQLYLVLDPSYKAKTCGLCGNFNNQQADDFQAINGVIEGTAAAFVNTWKTAADCQSVKNVFDDPCSLSVESEEYAKHWCGLLIATNEVFHPCHNFVNPSAYYKNCLTDTCSCEKSEDCMCAALSSYVRACAVKGVIIEKWQTKACSKYITVCPKNLVFSSSITSCQPTCRSLSERDIMCNIHFDPLPGCTCRMGYYMDISGKCVPAASCPCYFRGIPMLSGETIHESGTICTCNKGKLSCTPPSIPDCKDPMIYIGCDNEKPNMKGSECFKSCQTLDMQCYNTRCVPGCVCPQGLVSDDKGGCIPETQCPCIHNEVIFAPGDSITVQCNTCVCKNRMWECTDNSCLGTCKVYGDGHYITFDGNRYSFNGNCQYTLSQDHCSLDNGNSTFRVITENIPCGTTGMTCSKSIKVFLGSYELILADDHLNVVQRGIGIEVPYRVRLMGIYLVIEAKNGLLLLWDKKTSIFIKVTKTFKGRLCGLCGNFDGNGNNDFTTRGNAVVGNIEEFGNSWKLNTACPDAKFTRNACAMNPYRLSWAQKQCSIINSRVFSACHPHVNPSPFYDACVSDSCACNSGGDCECFCSAVAAYAQTCGEFGICISWRDPNTCPLFCDYYNSHQECEWHYKPCGAPCMKTCRNPSGKCAFEIRGLEGCYPSCPKNKPFFDEDEMKCVSICGCYDADRKHYKPGASVPSRKNCYVCNCTIDGINCIYKVEECMCEYQGHMYKFNETIYNATDTTETCKTAICGENGTIVIKTYHCTTHGVLPLSYSTSPPGVTSETTPTSSKGTVITPTTVSVTKISTSTSQQPSTSSTTEKSASTALSTSPISQTTSCAPVCNWTEWFDQNRPTFGVDGGDSENYTNIIAAGYDICKNPTNIQCRACDFPDKPLEELGQDILCDLSVGLVCKNKDQLRFMQLCYNYEVRFLCCEKNIHCTTVSPSTIITSLSTTSTPITLTTLPQTSMTTSQPYSTTIVCQPKCIWTQWFNQNTLSSGPNGGDIENYEHIINSGVTICKLPTDIQCRAKEMPDMILEELQQTVQCNLSVGLVCENKDQLTHMVIAPPLLHPQQLQK